MKIDYHFTFKDGAQKDFNIDLDSRSLEIIPHNAQLRPDWAMVANCRCVNCGLDEEREPYCPIALNITGVIDFFKDFISYDRARVQVTTEDRTYEKDTTIQNALSSLLGVYMVASGCPSMEKLKPMVRFHLPFATVEETVFRSTGAYLLGQYFLKKQGKEADMDLTELAEFYKGIHLVNHGIAERLRKVIGKDALNNAVICLDMFAKELPYAIDDGLEELKSLFHMYWKN